MGLGAKIGEADPIAHGTEHIDFDMSLLETNIKSKSGYPGVYATGSAFRALVPDPATGGTRYLSSRPTPLLAAIDRFRWCEENGFPYGNIGKHVEEHKKRHPEWTIEQCLLATRELLENGPVFGLKYPITLEAIDRMLERHRIKHGIAPPEVPLEMPKRKSLKVRKALNAAAIQGGYTDIVPLYDEEPDEPGETVTAPVELSIVESDEELTEEAEAELIAKRKAEWELKHPSKKKLADKK